MRYYPFSCCRFNENLGIGPTAGRDSQQKRVRPVGERSSIVLQGPITVGTSWSDQGVNKSIVAVDAVVDTPAGKFENCIKVKSAGPNDTIYQYYKKGVGMVKQEFIAGDTTVTSTLRKYQVK